MLAERVRHRDGKVRLDHPELRGEIDAARRRRTATTRTFPLRLIGLRELRSHNSWMHNAPLLMRGGRAQALRMHPDDAERLGLEDGGLARLGLEERRARGAGHASPTR